MNTLWVFDVDGVITDPREKRITEPGLLEQFVAWLEQVDLIAINTGRSLVWLEEKVIEPLEKKLAENNKSKSLLHNVFEVGEKGADWMEYAEDGKKNQTIDTSISVSKDLQEKVKKLVQEEFTNSMFFDDTKKTMISIEMNKGFDLDKFNRQQRILIQKLETLVKLYADLKIDPTVIATDIENKYVGKALGAQRIVDWLRERSLNVEHIYTFGDSASDIAMAEKFYEVYGDTKKIEFIFVGEKMLWDKKQMPFPIIHVPGFQEGTMEFLRIRK